MSVHTAPAPPHQPLSHASSSLQESPSHGQSPFKRARLTHDDDAEANGDSATASSSKLTDNAAAANANVDSGPISSSRHPPKAVEPPLPHEARLKRIPAGLESSYDPAAFPAELPKSTSILNYRKGLFLAPMVRIGALPTRLLSLEYGADLVWGPEIVDRALMGAERTVDEATGAIHYMKDSKSVFSTHPIERPYLIFQLGCATPAWAYDTVKMVTEHDDVAGVDLNCGCPKNFSTTGGMGAGLLPRPDLLCDILRAMRRAAPPHVAVTCKIRLLPTEEATKNLVRMICRTGAVDAITIHCRTKEMRPREKALLERINEVVDTVREETGGKMPVCHNGDSWDYHEAQTIMKNANVTSSMLARGPEKNPSCFSPEAPASIVDEIVPKWLKYAVMLDNHIGNTKYCLNVLDWNSSKGLKKDQIIKVKESIAKCKTLEEMTEVEHYKGKIDLKKCKADWHTYVMGDLQKVLNERQERRNGEVGKLTMEGGEGRAEQTEEQHDGSLAMPSAIAA